MHKIIKYPERYTTVDDVIDLLQTNQKYIVFFVAENIPYFLKQQEGDGSLYSFIPAYTKLLKCNYQNRFLKELLFDVIAEQELFLSTGFCDMLRLP